MRQIPIQPKHFATVRWSECFSDADADYIAQHLRPVDRYEAAAFGQSPETDVGAYVRASIVSCAFWLRDRPTFLLGAIEAVPGVFTIWGFGTDDTRRVMPLVTRVCRGYVVQELFHKHCARRLCVQIPAVDMCRPNIRWLKRIGFRLESFHPYATIDDEPVATLAVTKADYLEYVQNTQGAEDRSSRLPGSADKDR